MTYLDIWRTNLKTHLAEFAPLAKEDRSINLIYGITAAAVLWAVRDAPFDDTQKSALKEACGEEKHLPHLVRAVGGWDVMTQLEAARTLSKRQRESDELRDALTALMGTFIEELFEQNMVQHQHIDISGSVTGGNIVIGGHQIVAGDMVVQYITLQKIRACPTAPKPPTHFAGRHDELERLKDVLGQGQSVAITGIQGVGGIGKTALSLQLASEMREFSAVLWASLGPNPNTGTQLIEWARHADPDFDPGQDDIDMLANRVQALLTNLIQEQCPGRVLVILDDIWEGDSVRTARALQKAAPVNSVLLITTRSQLVVAQLRSTRLELQPMMPADALQMFRNLLSDYPEIPDDALLELAEVVGYHPLAMELAAGQVTLLERPTQEISEQIERYRGGIPEGSPFRDIGLELGDDREDNLEVVLALSYDSLPETEQSYFRALGTLAYNAPFDRAICEAIWETKPRLGLDRLRHRAMLSIAEYEGWYQQHSLLRAYARALLRKNGELDLTLSRYAEHITQVAIQFEALGFEKWNNLTAQIPHIHSVGDELVERYNTDEKPSMSLVRITGEFTWHTMHFLNNWRESLFVTIDNERIPNRIKWFEVGINIWEKTENLPRLATSLNNLGGVYSDLGDPTKALEYYEKALPLQNAVFDTRGLAITLNNIGSVHSALGNNSQALTYHQRALAIQKRLQFEREEAITLNAIGNVYSTWGRKQDALKNYEQALSLSQKVSDKKMQATILASMGARYTELGEPHRSLDLYHKALSEFRLLGSRSGEASTLNDIGATYSAMGQKREALNYYDQALSLRREVGDRTGEAVTLSNIGSIHSVWGDKQSALNYFHQALSLQQSISNKKGQIITLNNIGRVYADLQDIDSALKYYEQALPLARQIGDKGGEASCLNHIGFIHSASGKKDIALRYYERALSIRREIDDKIGEANSLNNIGRIHDFKGDKEKALAYYEAALELSHAADDKNELGNIVTNIASVYHVMKNYEKALEYFERALRLKREVGDKAGEASVLSNMAVNYHAGGFFPSAIECVELAISILKSTGLSHDSGGVSIAMNEMMLRNLRQTFMKFINGIVKDCITVMTTAKDHAQTYKGQITQMLEGARKSNDRHEIAFFEVVISILENGDEVNLPEGNPYQAQIQRIKDEIAE